MWNLLFNSKQAGQYTEAIELFEKIVEVEVTEHSDARAENLADLYYLLGDVLSEVRSLTLWHMLYGQMTDNDVNAKLYILQIL